MTQIIGTATHQCSVPDGGVLVIFTHTAFGHVPEWGYICVGEEVYYHYLGKVIRSHCNSDTVITVLFLLRFHSQYSVSHTHTKGRDNSAVVVSLT